VVHSDRSIWYNFSHEGMGIAARLRMWRGG
jgi:hypothetical protein